MLVSSVGRRCALYRPTKSTICPCFPRPLERLPRVGSDGLFFSTSRNITHMRHYINNSRPLQSRNHEHSISRNACDTFVRHTHTEGINEMDSKCNSLKESTESLDSESLDSDSDSETDEEDSDSDTENEHIETSLKSTGKPQVNPRRNFFQKYTREEVKNVASKFMERENIVKRAAVEYGLEGKTEYKKSLKQFVHKMNSRRKMRAADEHFKTAVGRIIDRTGHIDDLIPLFLNHARSLYPLLGPKLELRKTSNMALPPAWFPLARAVTRKLIYHAGPTNSGKTHNAVQHFLKADSAIYCAPLRMLAHEIFHRANREGAACDLLTGEEAQFASEDEDNPAPRLACTVEMASLGKTYDVAVIDEIQMIEDSQRGGAWTRALLGLPAREIHLCGHECAVDLVSRLAESMGEPLEVQHYERLSPLLPLNKSLRGEYDAVRPGDCVVAFSRTKVFEIRKRIERATKQQCAVIYGGLPPATRVRQAEDFNNPNSMCNVLVATDAIGMGLNLNIRRIVFHSLSKFDGSEVTLLTSGHTKQIAGRAGRFGKDHPQGEVTTFEKSDLPVLHKLMKMPIESVEQAGIYPSVEQIELFSNHLPNAKLHEILSLFYKMAKLDGNYFLCDFVTQVELASSLQDTHLPLRELFKFSLAPVDMKKIPVVKAFIEFAHAHSNEEEVSFEHLCHILRYRRSPPTEAKSVQALAKLEDQHETIDLYLWLSMRFPQTFISADKARELQEQIESMISKSIVSPKLENVKQQKSFARARGSMSEKEVLAMSDHLSGTSPRVFHRLEELAKSSELSGQLSSSERRKLQKEWNRCIKKVLRMKNVNTGKADKLLPFIKKRKGPHSRKRKKRPRHMHY